MGKGGEKSQMAKGRKITFKELACHNTPEDGENYCTVLDVTIAKTGFLPCISLTVLFQLGFHTKAKFTTFLAGKTILVSSLVHLAFPALARSSKLNHSLLTNNTSTFDLQADP